MPRGNRTGPWGEGPRTGRALGFCAGYDTPGTLRPGPGMRIGSGMGFRRGSGPRPGWGRGPSGPWHRGAYRLYSPGPPQPSPEEKLRMLREEADILSRRQHGISRRIKELENKTGTSD